MHERLYAKAFLLASEMPLQDIIFAKTSLDCHKKNLNRLHKGEDYNLFLEYQTD